jgi:hypothetical protein
MFRALPFVHRRLSVFILLFPPGIYFEGSEFIKILSSNRMVPHVFVQLRNTYGTIAEDKKATYYALTSCHFAMYYN